MFAQKKPQIITESGASLEGLQSRRTILEHKPLSLETDVRCVQVPEGKESNEMEKNIHRRGREWIEQQNKVLISLHENYCRIDTQTRVYSPTRSSEGYLCKAVIWMLISELFWIPQKILIKTKMSILY